MGVSIGAGRRSIGATSTMDRGLAFGSTLPTGRNFSCGIVSTCFTSSLPGASELGGNATLTTLISNLLGAIGMLRLTLSALTLNGTEIGSIDIELHLVKRCKSIRNFACSDGVSGASIRM